MDDQLKHLFDYTKFHIGMYTTLVAGIVGLFATDVLKNEALPHMFPFLKAGVILFFVAGMFGGLVASSIPFYASFDEFSKARLAPWSKSGQTGINAIVCTHIEHLMFWLGCLILVVGLFASFGSQCP